MYAAYTLFDDLTTRPAERPPAPPAPRRRGFADELKAARQELPMPLPAACAAPLVGVGRARGSRLMEVR